MANEFVYGIHAVEALLERQPERFIEAFALKGRQDERLGSVISNLQSVGISIQFVLRKTLDERAEGGSHQGIVVKMKPGKRLDESDLDELIAESDNPLLLILDGITDPHNLGACLRSADAAGATAVVIPKDRSVAINPTVRKVACGAAETMPLIEVTNLARAIRHIQEKGVWVVGTAGEAETMLYQQDLKGPMAIVMGAEGKGMRRLTRECCDQLVKLPMAGSVSSLNVSVATGICLFEAVRQRG